MAWEVHYFDTKKKKRDFLPNFSSREEALRYACTLEADNCLVQFIAGPAGERVMPFELVDWCKKYWSRSAGLEVRGR